MSESSMDSNNGAVLDPRIKDELELLNTASAEINRLEKQLDESRQAFRQTLTESTQSLNEKIKKCRKSANKAQGYYAAKEEARRAQELAQEAALRFQRASGMYSAARETISIAEGAALTSKKQQEQDSRRRKFDSALQEMLNLSTEKLNAAEQEKRESQSEHEKRSKHYITTQQLVDKLAKKFKRSISKSSEYYDLKKSFFYELNDLKIRTEALQSALTESKAKYRGALKHLEQISDDIHQSRQVAVILAGSRQSGVGAETERDSEHEKLDITFHIDDSTDGESVITDSSEPSSCASPTPRLQSRSISGSSLPSPAEWDNDKTQTNSRFNFDVGSNSESNNSRNGNSKRDSVPKIYMETVDDVEGDDDDDDDGDICFGVDIDSDSDDDTKGKLDVTRKLRTISIGDLKSFSVYDDGENIDTSSSTTVDESNRSDSTSNQATSEQVGDQTVNESSNIAVNGAFNNSVNETLDETITETVDDDAPSQPEKKDNVADAAVNDKANDEVVWI